MRRLDQKPSQVPGRACRGLVPCCRVAVGVAGGTCLVGHPGGHLPAPAVSQDRCRHGELSNRRVAGTDPKRSSKRGLSQTLSQEAACQVPLRRAPKASGHRPDAVAARGRRWLEIGVERSPSPTDRLGWAAQARTLLGGRSGTPGRGDPAGGSGRRAMRRAWLCTRSGVLTAPGEEGPAVDNRG